MNKLYTRLKWWSSIAATLLVLLSGCTKQSPTTSVELSVYDLKYRLIADFGEIFWCDPDLYPVARPIEEQVSAIQQFDTIKANTAEFNAILKQIDLPDKTDYTDEEKLLIYRQHKLLTYAIQTTQNGNVYDFTLRIKQGQGETINGTITKSGTVKVLKREASVNTCPICLAKGTLIDTPSGPVSVEQLQKGMMVWTIDESGKRIPAVIIQTAKTEVPRSFHMIKITLSDSRSVTASPGHPTSEGRPLDSYKIGDNLDGAYIIALDDTVYSDDATYDILPSGDTGFYLANGILLKSTLAIHVR